MMDWGRYWRMKKHAPKPLCFWNSFFEIDSFKMFKNKRLVQLAKESTNRISFMIPKYDLTAILQDDNTLSVQFSGGSYVIPVEQKSCNYGGVYYFFHCPECKARMRKLYCVQGMYLCRRCAHLGYLSQRLRPTERLALMSYKVKDSLNSRAGSLDQKPPWMKAYTFQKMRRKYVKYDEMRFTELNKELLLWYGYEGDPYFPSMDLWDAHVEREETRGAF